MARPAMLSVAFGVFAALAVAWIGPVYATPLVIVALPVIFLTVGRLATGSTIEPDFVWLLLAFGAGWLVVSPVAPIVRSNPQAIPYWVAVGLIPLALAAAAVARRRLATTAHQTSMKNHENGAG